jgi:hypothetical protein
MRASVFLEPLMRWCHAPESGTIYTSTSYLHKRSAQIAAEYVVYIYVGRMDNGLRLGEGTSALVGRKTSDR